MRPTRQQAAPAARVVREAPLAGDVPIHVHPVWQRDWPWLVQGTTGRGPDAEPFDLGLSGSTSVGTVFGRWRALRGATGCPRAVHSRQVHGARILAHDAGPPGLFITDGFDGHITAAAGLLLTVSIADCVPIFLVEPEQRAIAVLHGGWRGVAAGVLQRGLDALAALGVDVARIHMHLGPAICGDCYEVGAEVPAALGLEAGAGTVDLRGELQRRAQASGLDATRLTRSAHCTRCGGTGDAVVGTARRAFFSHRAGEPQRQMAVIGIRE
ncbi:MAG: polyphenol oxidase family protein [Longimicrobiales bacterium]